jgi:hypothetical protein
MLAAARMSRLMSRADRFQSMVRSCSVKNRTWVLGQPRGMHVDGSQPRHGDDGFRDAEGKIHDEIEVGLQAGQETGQALNGIDDQHRNVVIKLVHPRFKKLQPGFIDGSRSAARRDQKNDLVRKLIHLRFECIDTVPGKHGE